MKKNLQLSILALALLSGATLADDEPVEDMNYDVLDGGNSVLVNGDSSSNEEFKFFEADIIADAESLKDNYGDEAAIQVADQIQFNELPPPSEEETAHLRHLGAPSVNARLWLDRTMYYTVNTGVSAALVAQAAAELTAKTGIKFVQGTNGNGYVDFRKLNGCFSSIGRTRQTPQTISIGAGCTRIGTVVHEIAHALGLWHEQSNSNRDTFVTINTANITPGRQNNFLRQQSSRDLGIPYDYGSVMHYPSTAFGINGARTIVPKGPNQAANLRKMGQRSSLATSDAIQLQLMYHCPSSGPRSVSQLCTPDCPCNRGQGNCNTNADCIGALVCQQNTGTYNYLGQAINIPGLNTCQNAGAGAGAGGGGGGGATGGNNNNNACQCVTGTGFGETCKIHDNDPKTWCYTTAANCNGAQIGQASGKSWAYCEQATSQSCGCVGGAAFGGTCGLHGGDPNTWCYIGSAACAGASIGQSTGKPYKYCNAATESTSTNNACVDPVPSGLFYTSGRRAECQDIARFCTTNTNVAKACRKTCNTCNANLNADPDATFSEGLSVTQDQNEDFFLQEDDAGVVPGSGDDLSTEDGDKSVADNTMVVVGAAVGVVGVTVGAAALVVVKRRRDAAAAVEPHQHQQQQQLGHAMHNGQYSMNPGQPAQQATNGMATSNPMFGL